MMQKSRGIVDAVKSSTDRQWVIYLMGAVILSVSLLSCVTYIALMSKAFPDGMFRIACYIGAGANFFLMLALLISKFIWIRPGTHQSKFAWGATVVEVAVASLNLMLAYALSRGGALPSPLDSWYAIAPISPVFSMVGAMVVLMSSNDMKMKHKEIEAQEEMEEAEQKLLLQQHKTNIAVQSTYVDYIGAAMVKRLNSPEILKAIDRNADETVMRVISQMSGMSTVVIPERKGAVVESTLETITLNQEEQEIPTVKNPDTDGQIKAVVQKEGVPQPSKKGRDQGANTPTKK